MANSAPTSGRRYRGRTPAQLRAERRQRLIDAGLALFGERGYANAPIELLCATAKVATRHFYEQFDSREALLQAVFDDVLARTEQVLRGALTNRERTLH
ncbi:MAG: TetR/AcrR family transcriptional regulator, partial [Salinisphaera sp.]|nr:TetR/AcrR family transcriptional regulator [Salinisphaera sp.]